MKVVPYTKLKPGMICEDWDNGGKVVKSTIVVPRPGMKYDWVRVEFTDGTSVRNLVGCKMNVR